MSRKNGSFSPTARNAVLPFERQSVVNASGSGGNSSEVANRKTAEPLSNEMDQASSPKAGPVTTREDQT
jgi:hypothetical protein